MVKQPVLLMALSQEQQAQAHARFEVRMGTFLAVAWIGKAR